MKKKRFFCGLACIVLVLSILCGSVMPVNASSRLIYGEGTTITRAEWLHNLVEIFEMTVEDETYPDNYFSDLSSDSEYYYDILLAVQFGVVEVAAGNPVYPDAAVTREFAAHTLNFCLGFRPEEEGKYGFSDKADCTYLDDIQVALNRGWFALNSGKFSPNNEVTSEEVKKMLDDASAVIAESKVDENYENQYTVSEDVKEVPAGTAVEKIDENTLKITECPITIKNGDKFVVYFDELATAYTANSVSVDGNATLIDVTLLQEEAFDNIDAEGVVDADLTQIEAVDGAEIVFVDASTGQTYSDARAAQRAIKPINTKLQVKRTVKLLEGVKVNLTMTMKNPKIEYKINTSKKEVYVKLMGDSDIAYQVELSGIDALKEAVGMKDIRLINCTVPGIGGFSVSVDVEAGGKVSGVTKGYLTTGIGYSQAGGFRLIKGFQAKAFSLDVEATVAVGLQAKLGVTDMDVLKAYVYAKAGGKASVKSSTYDDGKLPKQCSHFAAYIYAECGATASVKFGIYSKSIDLKVILYDEKNSPIRVVHHYEDGKLVGPCSRGINWSNKYYTKWDSAYGGCGWSGGNGAHGYDAEGNPIVIYEYTLDEYENATITKYNGNARSLIIPDTLDGHKVVKIGEKAFAGNSLLSSVIIPDTVTEIGAGAFAKCYNLSDVQLSKNLTMIYAHAFFDCDSLRYIEIPKSLKKTEDAYLHEFVYGFQWGPFYNCDNLNYVSFESGTTEIANGLFANCPGLQSVVIPDTVTNIKNLAFTDCINLSNVKIGNSVTEIGDSAFRKCAISQISIPDSVITIGGYAFADCANLSKVTLSKKLEKMDYSCFANCTLLSEIEIPKSLTQGGRHDFYDDWGAFRDCSGLKKVTFEEGTTEIAEYLFANCTGLETIEIPDTVTEIENDAFKRCANLSSVKIGNGVTRIKGGAFCECKNLTSVTMGDNVTAIEGYAFSDCIDLTEIKLSKTLKELGPSSFYNCIGLTEIEIPKTLTAGGRHDFYSDWGAFRDCSGLKKVTFEEGMTEIPEFLFAQCPGLESIEIPDTVKSIESDAFNKCINLSSVNLGKGVEKIDTSVFRDCKSLKNIEIPESVKTLGTYVFYNCLGLEKVVLPKTITKIPEFTFYGCSSLKDITLPNTIEKIEKCGFENCTSLEAVTLPENLTFIGDYAWKNTGLKEVVIPAKCTSINKEAYRNCKNLEKAVISDSVTYLGDYVFDGDEVLANVELGKGITTIPRNAFSNCPAIKEIVLPYRLKTVGDSAFANDTSLVSVTVPRATTTIAANAFSYPAKMKIYGIPGTYAETYAKERGIAFEAKEVKATSVTLSKETLVLNKWDRETLSFTVEPADFTDEVIWKSTDTNIVTVNENGEVTAQGVGNATVKLTVGDVSVSCKVTVNQPITDIYLDKYALSMDALETYQLKANIYPSNATNKEVEWSSSDTSIATVDENGLVTALKKGTAVITATAKDGSNERGSCNVTVKSTVHMADSVEDMESAHNYENNCSDTWVYSVKGAGELNVTFDSKTEVEEEFDFIYIYSVDGTEIGKYTGKELSGKTILVPGDTVKVKLVSDNAGAAWGFKVTDISGDGKEENQEAGWVQNGSKWQYRNADGSYSKKCWQAISGGWYYFDDEAYMVTGWLSDGGAWYYLRSDGAMAIGWTVIDGKWYYLRADGTMATGWTAVNGTWYYLNSDGTMATGWTYVNGRWYYMSSDGAMATGWAYINSHWYYLGTDGAMTTGWTYVSGHWYYMDPSTGIMLEETWLDGTYYLKSGGQMAVNEWVDGGRYYVDQNGVWVPGATR